MTGYQDFAGYTRYDTWFGNSSVSEAFGMTESEILDYCNEMLGQYPELQDDLDAEGETVEECAHLLYVEIEEARKRAVES